MLWLKYNWKIDASESLATYFILYIYVYIYVYIYISKLKEACLIYQKYMVYNIIKYIIYLIFKWI